MATIRKKKLNFTFFSNTLFFILINLVIVVVVIVLRVYLFGDSFNKSLQFAIEEVYLNQFFRQPALFLGFLTFVGYLALKKKFVFALVSATKTAVGYLLLAIGSTTLISMAKPIFEGIRRLGGANVVPLDPYFGWISANSFLENGFGTNNYLSWVSYVFLIAFFINVLMVLLKRWTNIYGLMVTGHIMFQQAATVTAFVYILFFRNYSLIEGSVPIGIQFGVVLLASLFLGLYWAIGTTLTIKSTNRLTGNAGFGVGHHQILSLVIAGRLGSLFGQPSDSAETKKLPKWIRIFEDSIFSQTIILFVLFSSLILVIWLTNTDPHMQIFVFENNRWSFGPTYAAWNVFGNAHPVVNLFGGTIKLVATILVILTGVRMFVAELQQAFQGISEKIIPGAVLAVDIAATYAFAPNSLILGFVSGTIAQFTSVGVVILISYFFPSIITITVPLFITLFFSAGALGVFANATGGWKAAVVVPAIIGFFEILVISFVLARVQGVFQLLDFSFTPIDKGYSGMSDWNLLFGTKLLVTLLHPGVAYFVYFVLLITGLVLVQFVKIDPLRRPFAWKQKVVSKT